MNRPDLVPDKLGLAVVDEPLAAQSDPSLLDLKMRAVTRLLSNLYSPHNTLTLHMILST